MRVYYFTDQVGGVRILTTKSLRISRLDRLNDPFEFLGVDLSNRNHRRALRETKRKVGESAGLLCFSKSWHNPVLWGHYAQKHTGLCLGFDIPTNHLRHVNYVTSRFPWPDELNQAFMEQVLFSMFVHWSYEDEYRAWASLRESESDGHYYCPFSSSLTLRQVLVGAESSITREELRQALRNFADNVETFKTRPAFRSFRVVRNKDDSKWQ
jgi:hypothetical protein